MVLSELTANDLAYYLRLEQDEGESDPMIQGILQAAVSAVLGYTGLSAEEADALPELALAALIVGADLYEHRTMQVQSENVNPTAKTLMDMHRVNLL